ncbi:mRNA-decapping enzyme-like protein [Rosa chinensis]|uniref:mRNA-decapping enzyme-like protein n=1 Tax=Rosa chinensis TaxID=74649 RepID=UPI000D08B59E|nr:mRNA-decapping enzyme-like protein [Rosa chinensis]
MSQFVFQNTVNFSFVSILCFPMSRILGAYSKVPQKSTVSTTKSEFEELEAVPSMDVMDGPLEPSSSTASNIADAPDDHAFVNFFSAASHTAVAGRAYQSSTISVPLHQVGFAPSTISNMHISSPPQLSTAPSVPFLDVPESHSNTNLATSLVKPLRHFLLPLLPLQQ